jgi:hypothetical protein
MVCISCSRVCNFNNSCNNGIIRECDGDTRNIILPIDTFMDLTNDDTGEENTFKVIALAQDLNYDNKYILLQNVKNIDDKLILYYDIQNDEMVFDEITDDNEIDDIVSYCMSKMEN